MSQSTANDQFNPRLYGESMLIEKALADSAFKQALLSNPKATVAAEFGIELPDDLMVQVVEAQPDHFYLRLPAKPEIADTVSLEELTQLLSNSEDEVLAVLVAKAWKEDEFKQLLLNDPKAALVQQFGTELPATLTIEVLEETDDTVIVVLPPPADEAQELSNEQLEVIAGGNSTTITNQPNLSTSNLQLSGKVVQTNNNVQNIGTGITVPLTGSLTTTSSNQTTDPTLMSFDPNKQINLVTTYTSPADLQAARDKPGTLVMSSGLKSGTWVKKSGTILPTDNTTSTTNQNSVSNSYAPQINAPTPPW